MNKTLKKTLSIILTILMIVTSVPFAFAADAVDSGTCGADGDNLTWTLDSDGTLTISGTGAMATYSIYENLPPWAGHKENIKKIVIEEGVTVLGLYAFYGHTAVKYVSIADTVTTFNGRVFDGCSAIESLLIPASVSILESTSFRDCSSLKKIVFLGKVDLDSFYAFDGCSELREIVFAKGATNNNAIGVPFTNDAMNISETVIHFGGTQAEAEAAFAPIKEWDKIYSVATIHYIDGCNCSVCGEYHIFDDGICAECGVVCPHDSYTDSVCDNCKYECPHENIADDTCGNCGYVCLHEDWNNGTCDICGYVCFHESYTDGKCSVCDYECPHENCTDYICDNCGEECPHKTLTDFICDNCGYECTHESYNNCKCSVCGYECPHESYTDGKCSVCDYECPHESITDCKCDACGTEVTVITITMTDSYGDSWSGNAIVIKQLVDGAYTEVATATVANGYGYTFSANLPAEDAYSLNWLKGSYSEDCSFTVAVDGETVYECANGRNLTDSEMFYVICKHISYTDGKCSACGSACTHENYTDSKCDTCGYECLHEGQNGSCEVCGANLGKLVIDVTDKSFVEIGNGYDYYDEDGYIITGTNQNASVNIIEETALTLSNLTLGELYFNNAPDDSVINITLDGTTEVTEFVSLYRAHLIFDGGETDIFKVPYFTTAGNSGSVTVNSGNIILDCVTEYNLSAIACDGGFTINGGAVTASNNYFYVVSRDVTLNGGELNIISTAADREAISSDITMDKGALLTVSAESEILYKYGNIVIADGAQENDYFFVRYDTESEFVPVYDISAALDGKTYAEIKIDTHEHSFENGKCVCGYECPHESYTDGKCDVCEYVCTHEDGEGFDYEDNGNGKHTFTCYVCEFSGTADHIFENYTTVVNADCENNAWESGMCVCDATDRREIPDSALGHNPSGWWQKNETEHWRHCVNDSCSEEIEGTRAEHSYTWEVAVEATATTDGEEEGTCECGYKTTRVIPATGETPEQPDTPDEPADATCDHLCHKDGILGFFWKIISFLQRLFGIQQYCDCGVLHYDAPIFG